MEKFDFDTKSNWLNADTMRRQSADYLKMVLDAKIKAAIQEGKFSFIHETDSHLPRAVEGALERYYKNLGVKIEINLWQWEEQFHDATVDRDLISITVSWGYAKGEEGAIKWQN